MGVRSAHEDGSPWPRGFGLRDMLGEVRHEAWTAAVLAGLLAAGFAVLELAALAAVAAMVAGMLLMWISEEDKRLMDALGPGPAQAAAPPVLPAPAAPGSAVVPRAWVSPFPPARPNPRTRSPNRRARR